MTDAPTGGTPGGTPSDAPGNAPSSFVRDRTVQMLDKMQGARPSQGAQPTEPAADAQPQQGQQQQPPAEQKIKVGDAEYEAADVQSAIAERAEAQSRRATLPASADGYEVKLPADFQPPEGVRFEFDAKDPALVRARELAHKRGIDQETFSEMLGVYASTKMGEAIQQAQLRDVNMKQLGTAAPQRVEAVATWLQARAGPEGRQTADFLRRYPSSAIVKTMENLMRAFSNQGGADYSANRRAEQEPAGTIPGYSSMSFTEKRVHQMAAMLSKPGYRGGGGRNER